MGLFGSDDNGDEIPEEARQLIDNANHESVNADRLTKLKSGRMSRYLYDKPLIEYLEDGEQPHFILTAQEKVPKGETSVYDMPEQSGSGTVMHMISNDRWVMVTPNKNGDQSFSLPLDEVQDVIYSSGFSFHEIDLFVEGGEIQIPISNIHNDDVIKQVHSYLQEDSPKSTDELASSDYSQYKTEDVKNTSSPPEVGEFESHICIFPDAPERMSSIAHQETYNKTETITDTRVIRDDQHTKVYEYENIQPIQTHDSCIKLGKERVHIDYEDIINIEFVSKQDTNSLPNNFVRLVVKGERNEDTQIGKVYTYIYLVAGDHEIHTTGLNWSAELRRKPDSDKEEHKEISRKIKKRCTNIDSSIIILNDWIEDSGELRIEGLEKGNSMTSGTISGSTESEGSSTGIQVGPFSKSKTKSQGSIDGKIKSVTGDNTFSSDVEFVQIDRSGLYVESDPVINVDYSEIDRVAKRDNGIFLEIGQHSYSISGHGHMNAGTASFEQFDLKSIVSFIQDRMDDTSDEKQKITQNENNSSSQTPAEKIQDLKDLYDDGILSEEEFNSKKEELLDEL